MNGKSVLFVCYGNTCRSPLAEAILRKIVSDRGEETEWEIDSAGVCAREGDPPAKPACQIAEQYGITKFHQGCRARSLEKSDFEKFRYILGMDKSNIDAINEMKGDDSSNTVKLLGSYEKNEENRIIFDPYGGDLIRYERTYAEVCRAINAFLLNHFNVV